VKRENAAFLIGGLAFGMLLGFGLFHTFYSRPVVQPSAAGNASAPAPMGPAAPTQTGGGDAAPMTGRIDELKRRVQANPEDLEALIELVQLYSSVGMTDPAIQYFERAVAVRPDDPVLVSGLAHMYHDASRWEPAIRAYERALTLKPGDPDLLTDMGICYRGLGKYDRALELFAQASRANPQHWQSLYNTVVVTAFDLRRFDAADAALRELETRHPEAPNLATLRRQVEEARASGGGKES